MKLQNLLHKYFFATNNRSSYSVSSIIQNNHKNPLFVYRQTKQVCNTIKSLFNKIPQQPDQSIKELKRLFNNIHLSSFSSWKMLKQTSNFINFVLNQNLINTNQLNQKNLINLCEVLHSINYELDQFTDQNFIRSQVQTHFSPNIIQVKSQDDLKTLQVFSKHPPLFTLFQDQKKTLQQNLYQIIDLQTKTSKYSQHLISSIIKNGIYQSFWRQDFLNNLINTIQQSQINKNKFKSLLNALKLNDSNLQSKYQDEWTLKDTTKNDNTSNIITEQKIFNILKELDYDVQTNHCIFQYEVDYRLSDKFIVEYHGVHHYKTNTNTPKQTMKSNWKVQSLKNKGYKVFVVPFHEWNQIETIYDKKKWLIHNMEKSLFFS